MDQVAGLEPATSCLEGRNSTTELNLVEPAGLFIPLDPAGREHGGC